MTIHQELQKANVSPLIWGRDSLHMEWMGLQRLWVLHPKIQLAKGRKQFKKLSLYWPCTDNFLVIILQTIQYNNDLHSIYSALDIILSRGDFK